MKNVELAMAFLLTTAACVCSRHDAGGARAVDTRAAAAPSSAAAAVTAAASPATTRAPGDSAPRPFARPEFVGRVAEETPEGWTRESGALIELAGGDEYALETWRSPERLLLVFQVLDHRDADQDVFRVLETMDAPPTEKGEVLAWPGSCQEAGKPAADVFAVARYADAEMLGRVRRAWRLSWTAPHFRAIPPAGIACINQGWGA